MDHEIQECSFRPAKGGMISETRSKTAGGKFGPDYKTETAVHGSLGHAVRHLKSVMEPGSKKKEKSGSMKKA